MTGRAGGIVTRGKTASTPAGSDAAGNRLGLEQWAAAGKAVRATTPLEAHAEFQPAKERDPVGLLLGQAATRVPELVPIRHGAHQNERDHAALSAGVAAGRVEAQSGL